MRLVYVKTGIEVQVGEVVDGDTITGFPVPELPASSGLIEYRDADGDKSSIYPRYFKAEWIEREDRGE